MKPRLSTAFVVAAAVLMHIGSVSAQSAATKAAPPQADNASPLSRARSELAGLSPAALTEALDRTIASLTIEDALALVDEYLPKLDDKDKALFLEKTAGMALLSGAFSEASLRYESASSLVPGGRDAALLLKAGRCALAAGDAEKALELAALVLTSSADQAAAAGARLLSAWALAFKGKRSEALAIASGVAVSSRARLRDAEREALFLVWLCSEQKDKAKAAADLAAAFPSSIESLVASGAASTPPLPHWYLGELTALKGPASAASLSPAAASAAQVPAAAAAKPSSTASPDQIRSQAAASQPAGAASERIGRLQVGYFAVEANARKLATELAAKGFAVQVEARSRSTGPSEAAGRAAAEADRRWIVLVEAGPDPSATMKKLKDAGYESYGVE